MSPVRNQPRNQSSGEPGYRQSIRVLDFNPLTSQAALPAPPFKRIVNFRHPPHHGEVRCVMCDAVSGQPGCEVPSQNKSVCKSCSTGLWHNLPSGAVVKWCKGCKNFVSASNFGAKPDAAKCEVCRERGKTRYRMKKIGFAANQRAHSPVDTEVPTRAKRENSLSRQQEHNHCHKRSKSWTDGMTPFTQEPTSLPMHKRRDSMPAAVACSPQELYPSGQHQGAALGKTATPVPECSTPQAGTLYESSFMGKAQPPPQRHSTQASPEHEHEAQAEQGAGALVLLSKSCMATNDRDAKPEHSGATPPRKQPTGAPKGEGRWQQQPQQQPQQLPHVPLLHPAASRNSVAMPNTFEAPESYSRRYGHHHLPWQGSTQLQSMIDQQRIDISRQKQDVAIALRELERAHAAFLQWREVVERGQQQQSELRHQLAALEHALDAANAAPMSHERGPPGPHQNGRFMYDLPGRGGPPNPYYRPGNA